MELITCDHLDNDKVKTSVGLARAFAAQPVNCPICVAHAAAFAAGATAAENTLDDETQLQLLMNLAHDIIAGYNFGKGDRNPKYKLVRVDVSPDIPTEGTTKQ